MLLAVVLLLCGFSQFSDCGFYGYRTGPRYPAAVVDDHTSIHSPDAEYRQYFGSPPWNRWHSTPTSWNRWHSTPTSSNRFHVKPNKQPSNFQAGLSFPWKGFVFQYPFNFQQLSTYWKSPFLSKLGYHQIQPISHYSEIPFHPWRFSKPCNHQSHQDILPHKEDALSKYPYEPLKENVTNTTNESKTNILLSVNKTDKGVSKDSGVTKGVTSTNFTPSVTESSDVKTTSNILLDNYEPKDHETSKPETEPNTIRPNYNSTDLYDSNTDSSDIITEFYANDMNHTEHPISTNFPEEHNNEFETDQNVLETGSNIENTVQVTSTDACDSTTDSNFNSEESSEYYTIIPETDTSSTIHPDVDHEANTFHGHDTPIPEGSDVGNAVSSEYYFLPETTTTTPTEYVLETSPYEVGEENAAVSEDFTLNVPDVNIVSGEISGQDSNFGLGNEHSENMSVISEYISNLPDGEDNLSSIHQVVTTEYPDYYEYLPETTNIYDIEQSTTTENYDTVGYPTEMYYEPQNFEGTLVPELPEYEYDSTEEETDTSVYNEHLNPTFEVDSLEHNFNKTFIPTDEVYQEDIDEFLPTENGNVFQDENLDSDQYYQLNLNGNEFITGDIYHSDKNTNLLGNSGDETQDKDESSDVGLFGNEQHFSTTSNEKITESPQQFEQVYHNIDSNEMTSYDSLILNPAISVTPNPYDFKDFSDTVTYQTEEILTSSYHIVTEDPQLTEDVSTKYNNYVHESNPATENSQHNTFGNNATNEEKKIFEKDLLPNPFEYIETDKLKSTNSMEDIVGEDKEFQNQKSDQSKEEKLIGNPELLGSAENEKEVSIGGIESDEVLEDFEDEVALEDSEEAQMVEDLVDEETLESLEGEITEGDLQDEVGMEDIQDNISTDDLKDNGGLQEIVFSGEVKPFESAGNSNDDKYIEPGVFLTNSGDELLEDFEDGVSLEDFDGKMPVEDWDDGKFSGNLDDEILEADFAGKEAPFTGKALSKQANLLTETSKNTLDNYRRSDILIEDDNSYEGNPIISRKRRNTMNLQEEESRHQNKLSPLSGNTKLQSDDEINITTNKNSRVKRTFGTLFGGGIANLFQQNQGSFLKDVILKPILRTKYNYLRKKQLLVRLLASFLDMDSAGSMPFKRNTNEKDYSEFDSEMIFNLPKRRRVPNDSYDC